MGIEAEIFPTRSIMGIWHGNFLPTTALNGAVTGIQEKTINILKRQNNKEHVL